MAKTAKKKRQVKRQTKKAKKSKKAINFDNDAVYLENVYEPTAFQQIQAQCDGIKTMQPDPKAQGRLMHILNNTHPLIPHIFNESLINTVRHLTGNHKLHPCPEVPVEYRTYGPGSFMHWHRDQQMLPDQNQYECVITLKNTSDSETLLDYKKGIKSLQTKPNSLLVVRANGIKHSVSPTTTGSRSILKVVFSEPTRSSFHNSRRRRRHQTRIA